MIQTCAKCNHIIQEGERVGVWVEATYHLLKSTVSYALDKEGMRADAESMTHIKCPTEE